MVSKTRLLLLIALFLAGCGQNKTSPSIVDRDLRSFILPDAVLLAGVDMEQVRAAPLYQKLQARRRLPQLEEFADRTGFDPRKDVHTLLISSDGNNTVVAARGGLYSPVCLQIKRMFRRSLEVIRTGLTGY